MSLVGLISLSMKSFITKRANLSRKKNFLDSMCILLPLYSLFCFLGMILNASSLNINSWYELFLAYCFFVFLAPAILAINHSYIFSTLLCIIKDRNSDNNDHSSQNKKEFINEIENSTYLENELKISKLFQKQ